MKATILKLLLMVVIGTELSWSAVLTPTGGDRIPRGLESASQVWQRQGGSAGAIADSVRVWLEENGYLEGSVAVAGDSVVVAAGRPYRLERIVVGADSGRAFEGRRYLTRFAVQQVTDELLAAYYRRGYYFARLTVDSVSAADGRATLFASVSEGPVVTVGQCRLEGLKRTRQGLAERYVAARPGDTLTEELIARAKAGSAAIPFLRSVQDPEVVPRPGYQQADLVFRFEERTQVSLVGGVGYVAEADRKLLFNLDLTLRNLFGDGRTVGWLADHREANNNLMRLTYGQPLFLTGVGWLEGRIQTRDYRDQFYEFSAGLGYQARTGQAASVGLNLEFKRVEPATGPDRYRRYAAELTLDRKTADDPFNPTSGLDLRSAIAFAYRRYDADSISTGLSRSLQETQATFGADWYLRPTGRLVTRFGAGYRGLETSEALPPVAELLLIGGPGTLRGYRTEQFAVQRAALATVEPRFRFASGFVFAFCDLAYLNRPILRDDGTVRTEERFRYGYGAGIGLRDGRRSVRLGLAWNPEVTLDQPRVTVELSTDL